MDWWWILNFLINVASTESIPFFLSDYIESIILGGSRDYHKISVVPFLKT